MQLAAVSSTGTKSWAASAQLHHHARGTPGAGRARVAVRSGRDKKDLIVQKGGLFRASHLGMPLGMGMSMEMGLGGSRKASHKRFPTIVAQAAGLYLKPTPKSCM
eukprot:TRINITY_DN6625_c0_g1_i2.p2 TRINITY_DN6625_c0_g1~~TRINITY_DN6625_c0_g1_i2.p2  ORF type:complete len:105 (+),score=13.97 TRINITY_DN6625_c0_g1_i2:376-690(+)